MHVAGRTCTSARSSATIGPLPRSRTGSSAPADSTGSPPASGAAYAGTESLRSAGALLYPTCWSSAGETLQNKCDYYYIISRHLLPASPASGCFHMHPK